MTRDRALTKFYGLSAKRNLSECGMLRNKSKDGVARRRKLTIQHVVQAVVCALHRDIVKIVTPTKPQMHR